MSHVLKSEDEALIQWIWKDLWQHGIVALCLVIDIGSDCPSAYKVKEVEIVISALSKKTFSFFFI